MHKSWREQSLVSLTDGAEPPEALPLSGGGSSSSEVSEMLL